MEIPRGYSFEGLSGDVEREFRYWYPDSSVIYFTTFFNTLNYSLIRSQGSYYNRFDAIHLGDTITVKGIDEAGRYWKDILLASGVTIGYSNVGQDKVIMFEKALSSIKGATNLVSRPD